MDSPKVINPTDADLVVQQILLVGVQTRLARYAASLLRWLGPVTPGATWKAFARLYRDSSHGPDCPVTIPPKGRQRWFFTLASHWRPTYVAPVVENGVGEFRRTGYQARVQLVGRQEKAD